MDRRESSMLVFLDVMTDPKSTKLEPSGLEAILKQHGVEVTDGIPIAVRSNAPQTPPTTLTATGGGSENVLARQFSRRSFEMTDTARILKPAEGPAGRYRAEAVLQLEQRDPDRYILIENDPKVLLSEPRMHIRLLANQNQLIPRLSREPVTVGVAVTESDGGRPRMVVLGDVDFITNVDMEFVARRGALTGTPPVNYAFAASALEWMAGREDIGTRPKVSPSVSLDPTVDTLRMVILPGWLMMLTMVGLGIVIWVVRRR
jgi:hypothetical protein